jgi:pyrroline-5-carboxylate reductase
MKVGFAGSGNMAAAMARGLAASGAAVEMSFSDSGSGRAGELATELGGRSVPLAELADGDLVVLAVKPAALGQVYEGLAGYRGPVFSVLGATTVEMLGRAFPDRPVLRAMPNVAVETGAGTICHVAPGDRPAFAPALELFGRIATLIELPEGELDAATALMGCSPAYLALACEALIEAGVAAGLEPERAWELVSLGAAGTGELMMRHEPGQIRRAVASPGGSTEAGLEALEEHGAGAAYAAAVEASLARMRGEQ